jgi:hypothetical protein
MSVNHIAPSGPATISCGMKIPANLVKPAAARAPARPAGPGAASGRVIPAGPASGRVILAGPAIAGGMSLAGSGAAGLGDPIPPQGAAAAPAAGAASATTIPAAHTSGNRLNRACIESSDGRSRQLFFRCAILHRGHNSRIRPPHISARIHINRESAGEHMRLT